jgi:hypothetical protein
MTMPAFIAGIGSHVRINGFHVFAELRSIFLLEARPGGMWYVPVTLGVRF